MATIRIGDIEVEDEGLNDYARATLPGVERDYRWANASAVGARRNAQKAYAQGDRYLGSNLWKQHKELAERAAEHRRQLDAVLAIAHTPQDEIDWYAFGQSLALTPA